ncbi:MAG TPA: adenylosuccinate lyase, partial [Acidobacteriota bacterium]|nr:adenylosuccinate lyase [Acidobacteriota bacterium]
VYPEAMRRNLELTRGLIYSGQLLLALTERGVLRETAYAWIQRAAMQAWETGGDFQALVLADADIRRHLSEADIARHFSLEHQLRHVDAIFRRVFAEEAAGT